MLTLPEQTLSFGPFQLLPGQRLLVHGGKPVKVGSRALDILIALVDRAGEIVAKEELIAVVWPRAVVEDGALRVHVAALRKLLGDGQSGARYIVNVPSRGYSFIAPVSRSQVLSLNPQLSSISVDLSERIPASLTRAIGRSDTVEMLAAQLPERRLVTLVGPGGIGKTTVAVALANATSSTYTDGAYFVDLAPVLNPEFVAATVGKTLGLADGPENATSRISSFIRDKRLLIVFDNCEHVLAATSSMIEHLLNVSAGLRVLATCREPLRAEGEWLHHLPALSVPTRDVRTPSQAMSFSAYELFVERATASLDSFSVIDQDIPVVSDLCRRLDGNPLAIELAAARIGAFGLRGLADGLESHLLHLRQVRRTALGRHQTLSVVLDWSYQLLTTPERITLNRLSIFNGPFSLQAALSLLAPLASDAGSNGSDMLNVIADLGAKSWLNSDATRETVRYRMLAIPHTYAVTKLKESGEYVAISRRHALYVHELMSRACDAWSDMNSAEWFEQYSWAFNDIRAALSWCFSAEGDVLSGISLTALIAPMTIVSNAYDVPLALHRAIKALASLPDPNPELEVRLSSALLFAPPQEQVEVAGDIVGPDLIRLAEKSGDLSLLAEALIPVILNTTTEARYTSALEQAERLSAVARESANPRTIVVADRINAQMQHYAGNHRKARILAERVLRNPIQRAPLRTRAAGLDHAVSMRIVLSRILWLEGFPDQAASLALETRTLALTHGTLGVCQALSMSSCPIALWRGEKDLAQELSAQLLAAAKDHLTRATWVPTIAGVPWHLLWDAAEPSLPLPSSLVHIDHLITCDERLVRYAAVERAELDVSWCSAEIMRAYGERLLRGPSAAARVEAQTWFERALELSRQQGALSWELRAATSLARLWRELGRDSEACDLLTPVYQRYSEGFTTRDLEKAATLLTVLRPGRVN
jgi:predicted ATPase/DNA-binding winged helix-turn-helix (wHTH) protein